MTKHYQYALGWIAFLSFGGCALFGMEELAKAHLDSIYGFLGATTSTALCGFAIYWIIGNIAESILRARRNRRLI